MAYELSTYWNTILTHPVFVLKKCYILGVLYVVEVRDDKVLEVVLMELLGVLYVVEVRDDKVLEVVLMELLCLC